MACEKALEWEREARAGRDGNGPALVVEVREDTEGEVLADEERVGGLGEKLMVEKRELEEKVWEAEMKGEVLEGRGTREFVDEMQASKDENERLKTVGRRRKGRIRKLERETTGLMKQNVEVLASWTGAMAFLHGANEAAKSKAEEMDALVKKVAELEDRNFSDLKRLEAQIKTLEKEKQDEKSRSFNLQEKIRLFEAEKSKRATIERQLHEKMRLFQTQISKANSEKLQLNEKLQFFQAERTKTDSDLLRLHEKIRSLEQEKEDFERSILDLKFQRDTQLMGLLEKLQTLGMENRELEEKLQVRRDAATNENHLEANKPTAIIQHFASTRITKEAGEQAQVAPEAASTLRVTRSHTRQSELEDSSIPQQELKNLGTTV